MESRLAQSTPESFAAEDVRNTLDRILRSKYFVNAHKKKQFLQLICDFYIEGRAHELNEHILGYDVFGRDSSYNPAADPIVRVFAHEIRKKLEAYYADEGAKDPIHLEIPAGSYQPAFRRYLPEAAAESLEEAAPAQSESRAKPGRRRSWVLGLTVSLGLLCLAAALIGLAVSNWQLRKQVAEIESTRNPSSYAPLWTSFLADRNPPLVILSNPPILRFTNPSDEKSTTKNSIPLAAETIEALKDKFVLNPEISIREPGDQVKQGTQKGRVVTERNQTPRLIISTNDYTGIGEAIGLYYLTDFFSKAGRNISLKQSRTLSAEDLKNHNVIMLGGVWVNEWSSKLTTGEDFLFTSKGTIENRDPQPGEESEYVPQFDRRTGNLVTDYALITVKPSMSAVNDLMLLAGIYSQGTEATVEYVTNKNYLDLLNQRLQHGGASVRYFQALLKVGVENGVPTTISIIALHELALPER
jgi:hypothetical protein